MMPAPAAQAGILQLISGKNRLLYRKEESQNYIRGKREAGRKVKKITFLLG